VPRANLSATLLGDGTALLAGGGGASNSTWSSADRFDPAATIVYITNPNLPDGFTGTPYSYSLASSVGGTTITMTSGALPQGLNFGSGVISGTPTASGTYYFGVHLADGGGHFADQTLRLRIDALDVTTASLPSGLVGVAYSQSLAATGVGGKTWTLSNFNGTLPNGLTLNANGTITGTPAQSEVQSFTVVATDSLGQQATRKLSINVTAPNQPPTANADSYNVNENSGSDPNMVGFWPFNENSGATAFDLSGLGNDAAFVNGPVRSTDIPGTLGRSLDFNGTTQSLSVPTSPSLQSISSALTISAWVKPGGGTFDGATHGIISMPRDAAGTGWALRIENNRVNFALNDGPHSCSFGGSTATLTQDQWTHLAVTFQQGGDARLYKNGTLIENIVSVANPSAECGTGFPGSLAVSTEPLHIGREFDDASGYPRYFDGVIDEARVYSRELSASEIVALGSNDPLVLTAPGILANDHDNDSPVITAVLTTSPQHGTLQLNTDGSFTYAPTFGFNGTDSFTYRAFDGLLQSASPATVTIAVNPNLSVLGPAGGTGGATPYLVQCGPTAYAIGFHVPYGGGSGPYDYALTAAILMCSDAVDVTIKDFPASNYQLGCTPGDRMVGLLGFTNNAFGPNPNIAGIGGRCEPTAGGPINETGIAPAVGNAFGPYDCPTGQVVIGAFGRSGAAIDSLGLVCGVRP
jgi:VCBS repeat-containing protein